MWIESHQELARHPKTRKAARLLGISRVTMVGHLHFLWWWSLDFAQDGSLDNFDDDELAEAAEWEGDPADFVAALAEAGFIDSTRALHDWHDYAGKIIEQRKANAEKQKRWRERKKIDTSPPANANVTVTSRSRNGATVPNRTVPNLESDPEGEGESEGETSGGKRRTPPPAQFEVTPELRSWALDAVPELDIGIETEKFLDHHRAAGSLFRDWNAAWRKWMRNAPAFNRARGPTGNYRPTQAELNSGKLRRVVV